MFSKKLLCCLVVSPVLLVILCGYWISLMKSEDCLERILERSIIKFSPGFQPSSMAISIPAQSPAQLELHKPAEPVIDKPPISEVDESVKPVMDNSAEHRKERPAKPEAEAVVDQPAKQGGEKLAESALEDEAVVDKPAKPTANKPVKHGVNMTAKRKQAKARAADKEELTPELVEGVQRFVLFVGHGGSGHSIIGSLLDAHPHVVIPHQFLLFQKFPELDAVPNHTWRLNLYNLLYRKSVSDATSIRANDKKGYTLGVSGLWQGRFDQYIEVIGDKSGGVTTSSYSQDRGGFRRKYERLKRMVSVPIRVIFAVRNPFDLISSRLAFNTKLISPDMASERRKQNAELRKFRVNSTFEDEESPHFVKLNVPSRLNSTISTVFHIFDTVVEMTDTLFGRENVLEMHNCDLVADPRGTLRKIFRFLEVDTTDHYLEVCAEKVYKSVSRTRDLVEWPPELRELVQRKMKKYKMLSRYSFTSD